MSNLLPPPPGPQSLPSSQSGSQSTQCLHFHQPPGKGLQEHRASFVQPGNSFSEAPLPQSSLTPKPTGPPPSEGRTYTGVLNAFPSGEGCGNEKCVYERGREKTETDSLDVNREGILSSSHQHEHSITPCQTQFCCTVFFSPALPHLSLSMA